MQTETRPCDYCGTPVTKPPAMQRQRRFWTCGKSCAGFLRVQAGRVAAGWQPNRFRGMRDTRPCSECSRPITRYLTEQNHEIAWKCSRACAMEMLQRLPRKRRGVDAPCPTCGTAVYQAPGRRPRRFCSGECANLAKAGPLIEQACATCGSTVKLRPSEQGTKYCSRACSTAARYSRTIDRTHNGKPVRIDGGGYLLIYEPDHAAPSRRGWALEHRVVMATALGRALTTAEEVDHVNSDRQDNRIENLQLLDKAAHRKKTGADARKRRLSMRDRLAEYERRFGPLE